MGLLQPGRQIGVLSLTYPKILGYNDAKSRVRRAKMRQGPRVDLATFEPRNYRLSCRAAGLCGFSAKVKETDLWLMAESDLSRQAVDLIIELRRGLEDYGFARPGFFDSLEPLADDNMAPPLARAMLRAGLAVGTGPMAAVAGAVAQAVAMGLKPLSTAVAVENGGDLYLDTGRDMTIGLAAGESPFSGSLGLKMAAEAQPIAVGTSSGTVGHSLSMGRADAATILAKDAALADAAATALGNRIKGPKDLEKALEWAAEVPGVLGALAVVGESIAAWGDIELVDLG